MIRGLLIALVLPVALPFPCTGAEEGNAGRFADDFNRPRTAGQTAEDGFNLIGPNYRIDSGTFYLAPGLGRDCLRSSAADSIMVILEPETLGGDGGGFRFAADVAVGGYEEKDDLARGGLLFHYKDPDNFMAFDIVTRRPPETASVRLLRFVGGERESIHQDHRVALDRNVFYRMSVRAVPGGQHRATLEAPDGTVLYARDFHSGEAAGHAGFWRGGDKNLYWDDVVLEQGDGLLAGD